MLSFIVIFIVGRHFYRLAEKFGKNKWLFGILGVVFYYAGFFLFGILLALATEIFSWDIDIENSRGMGIVAMPFGLVLAYIFYIILKPNWEEEYQRKLIIERNKSQAFGVNVSTAKVEEEEENFRK